MEVIEHKGKRYLKASKAAREAGYTSDYVGQLCRGGLVDAVLVGRSWYVNAAELKLHRTETKRNARVKAREQVKKALLEHAKKGKETFSVSQSKVMERVRYDHDEESLIPRIEKPHEIHEPMPFMIPDSLRYGAPVATAVAGEEVFIADTENEEVNPKEEEVFVAPIDDADTEEEGVNRIQVHVLEELPLEEEDLVEEEFEDDVVEEKVEHIEIHSVEPKNIPRRREAYASHVSAVQKTEYLKRPKQRKFGAVAILVGVYACMSILFIITFVSLEADLTVENRATIIGIQRQMSTTYNFDFLETYRELKGSE